MRGRFLRGARGERRWAPYLEHRRGQRAASESDEMSSVRRAGLRGDPDRDWVGPDEAVRARRSSA